MRAAHALAALGAAFVLLYAGFVLGQQRLPSASPVSPNTRLRILRCHALG
jgi:hypothetical protein